MAKIATQRKALELINLLAGALQQIETYGTELNAAASELGWSQQFTTARLSWCRRKREAYLAWLELEAERDAQAGGAPTEVGG